MKQYVYRINSEWDIGSEYLVFSTKEAAMKWLDNNPNIDDILEEDGGTLNDIIDEGLISFSALEIVYE